MKPEEVIDYEITLPNGKKYPIIKGMKDNPNYQLGQKSVIGMDVPENKTAEDKTVQDASRQTESKVEGIPANSKIEADVPKRRKTKIRLYSRKSHPKGPADTIRAGL